MSVDRNRASYNEHSKRVFILLLRSIKICTNVRDIPLNTICVLSFKASTLLEIQGDQPWFHFFLVAFFSNVEETKNNKKPWSIPLLQILIVPLRLAVNRASYTEPSRCVFILLLRSNECIQK